MTRPLIVALHGVGSTGPAMGAALRPLEDMADVMALDGFEPFDAGETGRQWFSIREITEADRPLRVAAAIPQLLRHLDGIAARHSRKREDLVLVGFSQGAIMTLALIAQGLHAGRAIAIAGRLAVPVLPASSATVLLIRDHADAVMPPALSEEAARRLAAAGHRIDLALTEGVGHAIGPATVASIADWLAAETPSPKRSMLIEG